MSKRYQRLSPRARQVIHDILDDRVTVTKEEVIELVMPHYMFDPQLARERELKQFAARLIASHRDKKGLRKTFAVPNDHYVNVEKTESLGDLSVVQERLAMQRVGLNKSLRKIAKRQAELVSGQKDE